MNLPIALRGLLNQDSAIGAFCLLHVLARGDHLSTNQVNVTPNLIFINHRSYRLAVLEVLQDIVSRAWWHRQRVIQEYVLPIKISVRYGRFSVLWELLTCALRNLGRHRLGCCIHFFQDAESHTPRAFVERGREVDTARKKWQSTERLQLLPLLWEFRNRQAGALCDKVYALLPLVKDWGDQKALEVHYEWSHQHILTDATAVLIDVQNSLLPLMGTTQKSVDMVVSLPSWVPTGPYHG